MARKLFRSTAIALLTLPTLAAVAQISIEPPTSPTGGSTATPVHDTPTPSPTTAPSTTLPTAQSIMDQLKMDQLGASSVPVQGVVKTDGTTVATPQIDAVAPNAPLNRIVREGRYIWKRRGRLVRDDKTDSWLFAFDSDGQQMSDPPMGLIPSHLLELMETASENGTKSIKFDVSGEVTTYHKKNYLYVREALVPKDLNKGIGG